MTKRKGRILSVLLAAALTFTSMSTLALADEEPQAVSETGLCEHHPEHTDDCGYDEAAGSPCQYVCEECKTSNEEEVSEEDKQTTEEKDADAEDVNTPSSNESPEGDKDAGGVSEDKPSVTSITDWSWADGDELQETDGVWGIGMPGANEDNPLTQDILLSMLPTQINATTADGETVVVDITWDLSSIPEEGIWSGDHMFTASLPEGYELTDGANALSVKVELGGAETYALSNYLVTDTVSPNGTTINLFDYWNTTNGTEYDGDSTNGINSNNHQLHFNSGESNNAINKWTGYVDRNNQGGPLRGMVEPILTGGYPYLKAGDITNQNGSVTTTIQRESLAYLFDGTDHAGKEAYMDVDGLLQIDDDGYYYYNAAYNGQSWNNGVAAGFASANFASFNTATNSFELYNIGAVTNTGVNSPYGQFFPFNAGDQIFAERGNTLSRRSIQSNNNVINHYFGMSMSSRFVQQDGGKTEQGDEVIYQFSGDDDVWVFIDDVLVGDLGGIHDAASFEINFATGAVTIYKGAGWTGTTVQNTTLKALYAAAGKTGIEWGTGNQANTFADGTYHTLNFFYLERGNNDSNMSLKFNLVTVPQSSIFKVDQLGNSVPGATFELYAANENYRYTDDDLICTGTTNDDGEFVFVDDSGYLISIDDLYNRNPRVEYLVLKETDAPEGYRKVDEVHMRLEEGDNNQVVLLSSNEWETGAYASGSVTVSADPSITVSRGGTTKDVDISTDGGTVFAVILRYTGPDDRSDSDLADQSNWVPMYGDPIEGWYSETSSGEGTLASSISAAKKNAEDYDNSYTFAADSSGAYSTTITDLPGDIMSYYHMQGADKSNTRFALAFYYTEANGIASANESNTWVVQDTTDDFTRKFSVTLYVTDIKNNLYVQKTDEEGNPVSATIYGGATFELRIGSEDGEVWDTVTTTDMTDPFNLTGGAQFSGIPSGEYYLVETQAPAGFKLNENAVYIIVNDSGVYADAGNEEDGVSVARGVGAIVSSMVQFAADDDVDATLHTIKANLMTAATGAFPSENTGWSPDADSEEMHLHYDPQNAALNYIATSGGSATFEVNSGWSKLQIYQCLEHHDANTDTSYYQNLDDEGNPDLVNIFSGTVTVKVQDERVGGLIISKEVKNATSETANPNQLFEFIVNGGNTLANKEYVMIKTSSDSTETEQTVTFGADGTYTIQLKHNESVYFNDLPDAASVTVTEVAVNDFITEVSVNGANYTQSNAATVQIDSDGTAQQVDFRNIYQPTDNFAFLKTDSDNDPLGTAEFGLYRLICTTGGHDHTSQTIEVDSTGNVATSDAQCWELIAKTISSSNDADKGLVLFEEVPIPATGELYRLVEYKVPAGYAVPGGQWNISYSAEDGFTPEDGAVKNPPAFEDIDETVGTTAVKYRVKNYQPGELPFSGNIGIKLFLIIGGTLMLLGGAGGAIWYQTHRRVRVRRVHRRRYR